MIIFPNLDIGEWLGKSSSMTRPVKLDVLKNCWTPPNSYVGDKERSFIYGWLSTNSPWLCYSKRLKGALCVFCSLFPPSNVQAVLGSFIVTPFTKYKNMHDACQKHAKNQWHLQSIKSARSFMDGVPVNFAAVSRNEPK